MAEHSPWYTPFARVGRIVAMFVADTGGAAIILLGIRGIQWLLSATGEPKLFGWIPLEYLFHAMDLAVLLGLVVIVVFDVLEEVKR